MSRCFFCFLPSPFFKLQSMLSAISNWISNPRISPQWHPSDLLPSGSTSSKAILKIPINSNSKFSFTSSGSFAHGTILFQSLSEVIKPPPSYESLTNIRTAEDEKIQGGQIHNDESSNNNLLLLVEIESRFNDLNLFEESNLTLNETGMNRIELKVNVSLSFLNS